MAMAPRSRSVSLLASLALFLGTATACAPGDGSEDSAPADATMGSESDEPALGSDPVEATGTYTEADLGTAVVWYDGEEYQDFSGDCQISRGSGKEDVGDITVPGIKISVAVDNVKSNPDMEMNFVAINPTGFSMFRGGTGRLTGSITGIAYESDLTPKGTSQAMALVSFTGVTNGDVPVVAHVVC